MRSPLTKSVPQVGFLISYNTTGYRYQLASLQMYMIRPFD